MKGPVSLLVGTPDIESGSLKYGSPPLGKESARNAKTPIDIEAHLWYNKYIR